MGPWTPFEHPRAFALDVSMVQKRWARLHAGDREPVPTDHRVLTAWTLYHRGEFQKAYELGGQLGEVGLHVAMKSACVYAAYLEPKEKVRLDLYLEVAERAEKRVDVQPEIANGHYWQAYALARYGQGISVAKALALGLGAKIKSSLETTIRLEPKHADAHIALGLFHAEVIDKVGTLIGRITYGAKADTSLGLMAKGLELAPKSPGALMEQANALLMLEGDERDAEAAELYQKATRIVPQDAAEYLEVALAKAQLQD